jgi:hypothetical protein
MRQVLFAVILTRSVPSPWLIPHLSGRLPGVPPSCASRLARTDLPGRIGKRLTLVPAIDILFGYLVIYNQLCHRNHTEHTNRLETLEPVNLGALPGVCGSEVSAKSTLFLPLRASMRSVLIRAVHGAMVLGVVCSTANVGQGAGIDDSVGRLERTLAGRGIVDVEVSSDQRRVVLAYENLTYRSDTVAMGTALAALAEAFPASAGWTIVPKRRGTPLLRVSVASVRGPLWSGPRQDSPSVEVESVGSRVPSARRRYGQGVSSRGKFDLVLHPQVKAAFGQPGDPLLVEINLAPELVTTLARGTTLSAQAILPLKDELSRVPELGGEGIRPGRVALSHFRRPRGRWLALADVGLFEEYRYGCSLEAMRQSRTALWGVGGQVGCTGYLAYRRDGIWVFSDPAVWTGLLKVEVHTAWRDTALKIYVGQFLHRDRGARFDIARTFRRVRVGFFGVRTTGGSTGGIELRTPLSRSRWSSPKALRVRAPAYFPWTYRFHTERCGYVLDGRHRIEDVVGDLHPSHVANRLWELKAAYEAYAGE